MHDFCPCCCSARFLRPRPPAPAMHADTTTALPHPQQLRSPPHTLCTVAAALQSVAYPSTCHLTHLHAQIWACALARLFQAHCLSLPSTNSPPLRTALTAPPHSLTTSLTMPKEKTTRKAKASKADGKKKKGTHPTPAPSPALRVAQLTASQTPTHPSAVFLPTCSSPTTCAIRFARRTPASSLVRRHDPPAPDVYSRTPQARSARSWVRGGRLFPRSSAPPTRPRLRTTRRGTRTRRLPTTLYVTHSLDCWTRH